MPAILRWGLVGAGGLFAYSAGKGAGDGLRNAITGAGIGIGAYYAIKAYRG